MVEGNGKVAVVTGASRGAGKGIAVALGRAGYRVYVTGRSVKEGDANLPGTVGATAEAVTQAGGQGIAVQVDHASDEQVRALFEQVDAKEGRLDLLVNNVAAVKDELIDPANFWEKPLHLADILDVGLRSQYVASYYAAPLMVRAGHGLIGFTSSFGAVCYMHGAAYGAQKAGVDKMAADMAVDFKGTGVSTVSIWMGPMLTERAQRTFESAPDEAYQQFAAHAETPEFTGVVLAALAEWDGLEGVSGQTLIAAEIAERLGVRDSNGKQPPSYRDMLGEPRQPHPAIIR
ncbi:SDR family NAD(P)-dependent oxidoreductase [Sphingobium sp. WCS2017Hpa-17]|uniref:SDR family NAD(P)-dependent oxidoreductase n=1 Tax=Sphingobium sp. WCS2017Hpa-17 TaxID=3073638 RepID=UPI00288A47DB|nr:SDR family NAD(P)-dependent oxidoreductase [Sphingobium sp. WCS2017Hpa-17]